MKIKPSPITDMDFAEAISAFDNHIELEWRRDEWRRWHNAHHRPYEPPATPDVSFPQNAVYVDTRGPNGPEIVRETLEQMPELPPLEVRAGYNCLPAERGSGWWLFWVAAVVVWRMW